MRKGAIAAVACVTMLVQGGTADAQMRAQASPPPPPPMPASMPTDALTPTSVWAADYEDNSCALIREFGSDNAKVVLAIKPVTGAETIQFLVTYHGEPKEKQVRGPARLAFYPSATSAVGGYNDTALPPTNPYQRAIVFTMQRKQLADLSKAETLAFVFGHSTLTLTPRSMNAVVGAMKKCEDDLVKRWGYDPAVLDGITTRPAPIDPFRWYNSRDFPKKDSSEANAPSLRYTVGTDGKVTNCAVVESSGSAAFDAKACELLTTRAKFKPATNAAGSSVAALVVSPVYRPAF